MLRYRERTQRRHHRSLRLHQHAADNLKFIRDATEHSSRFTDVPGRGMVVIGATAILAAAIASAQSTESSWLAVWAIEAGLAIAVGLVATELKARSSGSRLFDGPQEVLSRTAGAGLTAFLLAQNLASARKHHEASVTRRFLVCQRIILTCLPTVLGEGHGQRKVG